MEATHLERFWDHFRAGPLPARELETVLPRALAVGALLARPAVGRCRAPRLPASSPGAAVPPEQAAACLVGLQTVSVGPATLEH